MAYFYCEQATKRSTCSPKYPRCGGFSRLQLKHTLEQRAPRGGACAKICTCVSLYHILFYRNTNTYAVTWMYLYELIYTLEGTCEYIPKPLKNTKHARELLFSFLFSFYSHFHCITHSDWFTIFLCNNSPRKHHFSPFFREKKYSQVSTWNDWINYLCIFYENIGKKIVQPVFTV